MSAKGTSSRREVLEDLRVGPSTHPGLWLDKYLTTSDKADTEAKGTLISEVIKAFEHPSLKKAYKAYFRRYREAVASRAGLTYGAQGRTRGRLSVGLGANSVLETSILLHRTYGVPYIPGSALKGLASSYAAKYFDDDAWKRSFDGGKTKRGALQKLIFGDTEESGLVIFFDALPDPDDKELSLDRDVITVHHPDYYQGKGEKPPADWDSPNPVPFITARGKFHFYLGLVPLPESELEKGQKVLELAAKLLKLALEEEGVGAKTTIGYGRFAFEKDFAPIERPKPKRSELYETLASRVKGIRWNTPPHELEKRLADFFELSAEEQKAFLVEFRANLEGALGKPPVMNPKFKKSTKLKELFALMQQMVK